MCTMMRCCVRVCMCIHAVRVAHLPHVPVPMTLTAVIYIDIGQSNLLSFAGCVHILYTVID